MILDAVIANTNPTVNNDRFTAKCLRDIADKVNKNPNKYVLRDSLNGTKILGKTLKADFDGKRLHVYFEFNRPYVSLAGNLPGKQGLPKANAFETLEIDKLEDVTFGFTSNSAFKNAHAFKVSGSVCSKCYRVDVTEEDEIVED